MNTDNGDEPGNLYVVTMYRWADRERHSYVQGVFQKKHKALACGKAEYQNRGGKYTGEVVEFHDNGKHAGKKWWCEESYSTQERKDNFTPTTEGDTSCKTCGEVGEHHPDCTPQPGEDT